MTAAAPRLAAFAVGLALLFGAALLAGGLIDPAPPRAGAQAAADAHKPAAGAHKPAAGAHKEADAMNAMTNTTKEGAEHGAMDVRGLSTAAYGLRLALDTPTLQHGKTHDLRFRIVDEDGAAVRDFDTEHTKRMHLIVVRRDLTGFQHLHPRQDAAGTWHSPLKLAHAGSYRVFADFSHAGKPQTLATDLTVNGEFAARPLATPRRSVQTDGFDVDLSAPKLTPGTEAALRFQVTRDGRPVSVQPYLGADGHLVALRDGDLAFLHVHPTDTGDTRAISFDATFPTAGAYALFLQFKVDGQVHTAAFTREVRR